MSNNKQYYYNKGEEDGPNGTYNPPHSSGITTFVDSFICSKDELNRQREEKEAYDMGYENSRKKR